jgi:hypothetical protein
MELSKNHNYNYSFELYGSQNEHLVKYDIPLDIRLLFALDKDGKFYDPEQFNFPTPDIIGFMDGDLETEYAKYVDHIYSNYLENSSMEGYMLYIFDKDKNYKEYVKYVWKCKPYEIAEEQSAENEHKKEIANEDIKTTIINGLENINDLDFYQIYKLTIELLKETYCNEMISNSKDRIVKIINNIISDLKYKQKIISEFESLGITWNKKNVKTTMLYFKKTYTKKEIGGIFQILNNHYS